MNKLILMFLPLSLLVFGNYFNQRQIPALAIVQSKQAEGATIKLVSPDSQTPIPMGDTEIILEVVNSNGEPIKVEELEVAATMPMQGMEDMIAPVEVEVQEQPGRFKLTTYLGMQGTWKIIATAYNSEYQVQQEFIFEVQ